MGKVNKPYYYFEVADGIIVGHHSDDLNKNFLPVGTEIVKASADNPNALVGLNKKYLKSKTLPKITQSNEQIIRYKKGRLRVLKSEIDLLIDIGDEDTSEYRSAIQEYENLKKEYRHLKNKTEI